MLIKQNRYNNRNKMNYSETINYLFSSLPVFQREGKAAYKADLNRTIAMDKYFSHPHKAYKTIHIAGTNGKGSVSHILSSIFQEAGYRTGLYTSPHLRDFRERIKINGYMVSESYVINFVEQHKLMFEEIKPSFFEMTVAMAYEYFRQQKVDIAIIETGLGGRLDSTNIINPLLSIITNISMDHTDLLGNTITEIATEKAGIIKRNTPVLIGESDRATENIFATKAKENNSPISYADKQFEFINTESIFRHNLSIQKIEVKSTKDGKVQNIKTDLKGEYQKHNIITVLEALKVIDKLNLPRVNQTAQQNGFINVVKNTALEGRWQLIGRTPDIICDTAHNEAGIKQVVSQLAKIKYNTLHIVFGMVGDKSIDKILPLLPNKPNVKYYFTQASIERAMPCEILAKRASEYGLTGASYPKVELALAEAQNKANCDDIIFVGGSTYVVADVLGN